MEWWDNGMGGRGGNGESLGASAKGSCASAERQVASRGGVSEQVGAGQSRWKSAREGTVMVPQTGGWEGRRKK